MSDTLPDIDLLTKEYTNLFTASGIAVGTEVIVENKGNGTVWIQEGGQKPSDDSIDGTRLFKGEFALVDAGASGLWGKGLGQVGIHENTQAIRKGWSGTAGGSGGSTSFSKTVFGENLVAEQTPLIQATAVYGFDPRMRSIAAGTGATALVNTNNMYECNSGTTTGNFSSVFTRRANIYHAGQGIECKFSAIFDTPSIGSEQFAGFQNSTDALVFGYGDFEGANVFGVWRRHDGQQEINELTITTPAGGAENATVTVDGNPYIVALTTTTTNGNATEIADSLNAEPALFLWIFQAIGSKVIARSLITTNLGNTFAFSSATAVASWANIAIGSAVQKEFIPQSQWNGADSSFLNPQTGNVYRIQYKYLGFGGINYQIENPITGEFQTVHTIEYNNSATVPSVSVPHFRVGWASVNTTGTTSKKIQGASISTAIEGKRIFTEEARSFSNEKLSVGSTPTNILTIGARATFGDKVNVSPILPLKVSASTDSTKGAVVDVIINTTLGGDPSYDFVDETDSIAIYDTDGTTVSGGQLLDTVVLGANDSGTVDLSIYNSEVLPDSIISLVGRVPTGTASEVRVALTWREDK